MAKFKYEVELEEKSQLEADVKMNAAITLLKKLPVNFLDRLAFIAKNEPEKVAMAKSFLGL